MQPIVLNTWVVEDDPAYRDLIEAYVQLLGHKTRTFAGEDCLEHLESKPDVVILDHDLGKNVCGIDILRFIKFELPNTVVIYLSGQEKISVVAEAQRQGSDDYIGKDSASLLRLKLKLETILQVKLFKLQKKKNRARFMQISLIAAALLAVLLFFILRNI